MSKCIEENNTDMNINDFERKSKLMENPNYWVFQDLYDLADMFLNQKETLKK